jgi:hypothetical protein
MRLVLPTAPSWQARDHGALRTELVLEGTFDAPDLALIVHHPRSPAASFRAFIESVMTDGVAADETLIVDDEDDLPNDFGWRARGVYALVRRPDRADPIEMRLGAFYRFLGHDAAALAIGRRAERFAERRHELLELFAKGRPDWNGPLVCALAQIYR